MNAKRTTKQPDENRGHMPGGRSLYNLREGLGPKFPGLVVRRRVQKFAPHPSSLPASGERDGPAEREG